MLTLEKLTKQFIEESGWSPEEAPKFAKWYIEVDKKVQKAIGLSIWSIGDWCYADAFEDGCSPAEAADEVIREFRTGRL